MFEILKPTDTPKSSDVEMLRMAVEAATGGKNTVLIDDRGLPSIVVRIPKHTYADVGICDSNKALPAFIVEGMEKDCVYVDKYQSFVYEGRAYSRAGVDPTTCIDFDPALMAAENKGPGWTLLPHSVWAALALISKAGGTMPYGNNNYGSDYHSPLSKGMKAHMQFPDKIGRVLTGSGPVTWSHNGQPDGVWDLNGNVHEWNGGLRLMDGEIQVMADAEAFLHRDQSPDSGYWRAISLEGRYVTPGTTDATYKYDSANSGTSEKKMTLLGPAVLSDRIEHPMYLGGSTNADYAYCTGSFEKMKAREGLEVCDLIKALALFPLDDDCGGNAFNMRNYGERMVKRGGDWDEQCECGVFYTNVDTNRRMGSTHNGFRCAYMQGM